MGTLQRRSRPLGCSGCCSPPQPLAEGARFAHGLLDPLRQDSGEPSRSDRGENTTGGKVLRLSTPPSWLQGSRTSRFAGPSVESLTFSSSGRSPATAPEGPLGASARPEEHFWRPLHHPRCFGPARDASGPMFDTRVLDRADIAPTSPLSPPFAPIRIGRFWVAHLRGDLFLGRSLER